MILSRTTLIAIIVVLAAIAAASLAGYVYEQNKASGIEIRIDKNGLRIDEN